MGSDMAMESRSFEPRPPKGEWQGSYFVVYTDHFIDGYKEVYRVPHNTITIEVRRALKAAWGISEIPPKPVTRREQAEKVLKNHYMGNITTDEVLNVLEKLYGGNDEQGNSGD